MSGLLNIFREERDCTMAYLLLLIGFVLLIKGADFFVDGSSWLARRFKVSPLIIGLTIVAFGTSAPEAAVSFQAAINGNAGIVLGNVIGSNLINTSLIVGTLATISVVTVSKNTVLRQIPFILISTVVVLFLMLDIFNITGDNRMISQLDGLILLILFIALFAYTFIHNKRNPETFALAEDSEKIPLKKIVIYIFIGLAGIIFGGRLVLDNSVLIANSLGVSETLIGITIVGVGTSLPELVTSISAAVKKENEIAIGNIIGSNLFNLLFILGISALITPLAIDTDLIINIVIMIAFTIILWVFALTKKTLSRKEGFSLIFIYFIYLLFILS